MSKAVYIIFETQEVFDSREDLAKELGVSKASIDGYLYTNRLWNGLHLFSVPDNNLICLDCKIILNDSNWPVYYQRDNYRLCRGCKNKRAKIKAREFNVKRYGITLKDYDNLLEKQKGVCAICHEKETGTNQYGIRKLSIDHSHESGEVRGLLCGKCNHLLGLANDSAEILMGAINYLGSA